MTENATLKLNSLARRTNPGDDLSVYPKSGSVMAIRIALMVRMRIQHSTIVQRLSLVPMISLPARTDVASTKGGLATTTTIAVMDQMKGSSVTLSTKRVRLRNLLARTSNASEINIDAVRKFYFLFFKFQNPFQSTY